MIKKNKQQQILEILGGGEEHVYTIGVNEI
jgi:hypothetical protein